MLSLKRKETLYLLNVGKVLIYRGNHTPLRTTFIRCFKVPEQQNKSKLFDKADRERKRLTPTQVVFCFIKEFFHLIKKVLSYIYHYITILDKTQVLIKLHRKLYTKQTVNFSKVLRGAAL